MLSYFIPVLSTVDTVIQNCSFSINVIIMLLKFFLAMKLIIKQKLIHLFSFIFINKTFIYNHTGIDEYI